MTPVNGTAKNCGGSPLAFKDGPREQGRYRVRHRAPPDRLFTLAEMAVLLGMHPKTLRERVRAPNGTIPPAFQPGGPGTAWKFSERSYQYWLAEKNGESREATQ